MRAGGCQVVVRAGGGAGRALTNNTQVVGGVGGGGGGVDVAIVLAGEVVVERRLEVEVVGVRGGVGVQHAQEVGVQH